MTTKLTLTVDKETIEQAKKYAKEQGRSLSNIVENYLKLLSAKEQQMKPDGDLKMIKSLRGSLKPPEGLDDKKTLEEELAKKYLDA